MKQFIGIVHQEEGSAFGIQFPDVPGCFSAADDIDDLTANAQEALALYFEDEDMIVPRPLSELQKDSSVIEELTQGGSLMVIPVVDLSGRTVKANLTMDAGLLKAIDDTAKRRGMTRSAFVAAAARKAVET